MAGDFVSGFYNPRSEKRDWQLGYALDILRQHRPADTPIIIARNITRSDQQIIRTTLAEMKPEWVDMFTLVLVGNSQSYAIADGMATPRGYVAEPEPTFDEDVDSSPFKLPLALTQLAGKSVKIVGGGVIGERKARTVLEAGATVTIISPVLTEGLATLLEDGQITWVNRPYRTGDLAGAWLAYATTDIRLVNQQVGSDARHASILCNVADAPHESSFHSMAVARHGEYVIGISSTGSKPSEIKQLKEEIGRLFP